LVVTHLNADDERTRIAELARVLAADGTPVPAAFRGG